MNFTMNMGSWNSVFAVPAQLVDIHLKLAGAAQLKVILWILRNSGAAYSSRQVADSLGMREDDVEDALEYWMDCGLLSARGSELLPGADAETDTQGYGMGSPAIEAAAPAVSESPIQPPSGQTPVVPEPVQVPAQTAAARKKPARPKPDGLYLATRMAESPQLQFLIRETENLLGKTLSPALSSALLIFFEDYGLPVEVILMMIHYASDIGKTGTAYIESLGRDWAENEIFTIEAAEQKLQDLDLRQQAWSRLGAVIGIHKRAPSKKESAFAYEWFITWKTSAELVGEAYERCVDKTGKLSLAYMNKILEKWYNSGITNLKLLSESEKPMKEAPASNKSYNLDEIGALNFFIPSDE